MRITHVIPALTKGGAERVLVDLANAAVDAGHEVSVIAAAPAPSQLIADRLKPQVKLVYVDETSVRSGYAHLLPWLLRNRHWLFGQDIVHCHLTFGSVFGAVLQVVRRLFRARWPAVVETYHAVGMAIPKLQRAAHALLLGSRDAVAFMAEDPFWLKFAAERPQRLMRKIPNGIVSPSPVSRDAAERYRKEHTAIPAEGPTVLGSVGRLVPARRPDMLMQAFAKVTRAAGSDTRLLLAGSGSELKKLADTARELGIERQVELPGLALDPREPMALMDIYITVSIGPITGIAAIEAAFLGLPIVGFQMVDAYRPAADDWIWSSGDLDELAERLTELVRDPAERHALADRQQAYAIEHHGHQPMVQAYEALYGRALALRHQACHLDRHEPPT